MREESVVFVVRVMSAVYYVTSGVWVGGGYDL